MYEDEDGKKREAFAHFIAALCERYPPEKPSAKARAHRSNAVWFAAKGYYIADIIVFAVAGGLPGEEVLAGHALIYG